MPVSCALKTQNGTHHYIWPNPEMYQKSETLGICFINLKPQMQGPEVEYFLPHHMIHICFTAASAVSA